MTPDQTSGHTAAISLSEDGKDPYVSIFYTVDALGRSDRGGRPGAISFTALLVAGTEAVEEESRLVYNNGSLEDTTNPDEIEEPLVVGTLYQDGRMHFEHGVDIMLRNEEEALSLICVMRALYQMQGELTKEKE